MWPRFQRISRFWQIMKSICWQWLRHNLLCATFMKGKCRKVHRKGESKYGGSLKLYISAKLGGFQNPLHPSSAMVSICPTPLSQYDPLNSNKTLDMTLWRTVGCFGRILCLGLYIGRPSLHKLSLFTYCCLSKTHLSTNSTPPCQQSPVFGWPLHQCKWWLATSCMNWTKLSDGDDI